MKFGDIFLAKPKTTVIVVELLKRRRNNDAKLLSVIDISRDHDDEIN